MSFALEFRHVDILFAQNRAAQRNLDAARQALHGGSSRADVTKQFGVVAGIVDANLGVVSGEIAVLMGLSGSGKSTLLRAANRLNRISSGEVRLLDGSSTVDVASCSIAELRRVRRQRIAMVFQQFGLLPWRSVRDNVGFGLELRGDSPAERKQRVDEKLELVGLTQWADRSVGELSGGMQQRVGLARAFATDADILLMDEPFSALDPLIRTRLQDELLALQARVRKTILFVTHDLDEALRIGNQISILEGGRIVQTGQPRDIVLQPANDYVAAFVQHMNMLTMLTGELVMRAAAHCQREDRTYWLDPEKRFRVDTDPAGNLVGASSSDGELTIQGPTVTDAARIARSIGAVPCQTSLQAIITLANATQKPVMVTENGRFLGVCGPTEIVAALDRSRASSATSVSTPK
jgi:glycine betaine/proline transport system ATP-binding protein